MTSASWLWLAQVVAVFAIMSLAILTIQMLAAIQAAL